MNVNDANECFKEGECGHGPLSICFVEEKSEKKQRRWSGLPTVSPKSQCHFLSFGHFLSSLPKIPSARQTGIWILKCDFSLVFEECGVAPPSFLLEKDRPNQGEDSDVEEKRQEINDTETQNDKWPLLRGVERSHSAFIQGKNAFTPSSFELESFRATDAISQCQIFENEAPTLKSLATGTSCLFSNHEEMSESTSRGKSPEMNPSLSSCSASSSNCFSVELNVGSADFVCYWNTCNHKEKNTDRLFHHILHSHLHRSTDFRSTRCLWRGCSRDGILKVFNSRHKLLVHVGIHCQKLKEPQEVLGDVKDQTPCAPQTEQKDSSLSNSMQNLLGLRRLFMFRKNGQSFRWPKQ